MAKSGASGLSECKRVSSFPCIDPPNAPRDSFRPVRMFWDALRDAFHNAVDPSWLLVLDESMVRWMGKGMPGLMVILASQHLSASRFTCFAAL
eukprot:6177465-Pleurochrysis_carterae.AAC.3